CVERLGVGNRGVFGTAHVVQPRMLGADARIVEARGDRMRLANLSELVLQQVSLVAVQNADAARSDRGRMMRSADAETRGLDADHPHIGIFDKRVEKSDRV